MGYTGTTTFGQTGATLDSTESSLGLETPYVGTIAAYMICSPLFMGTTTLQTFMLIINQFISMGYTCNKASYEVQTSNV